MAKDKLTEYDATANNNTVVGDVNLAENSMNPSDVNNALREIMSHQKEAFGAGTPLYVDQANNRVGVNKTPTVALDVNGALSVSGALTQDGGAVFNEGSADVDFRVESNGNANMLFVEGETDRVAIGHNDPSQLLDVRGTGAVGVGIGSTNAGGAMLLLDGDSNGDFSGSDYSMIKHDDAGRLDIIQDSPSGTNQIRFFTAGTSERARIHSDGSLFYGTTANVGTGNLGIAIDAGDRFMIRHGYDGTGTQDRVRFYNNNGLVGRIQTAASSTTYATSSDYRLKENVITDWDATTRLKQLKPSRFNFIADADTTVDGFLAHEVQEIVPEAISGTKDGTEDITDVVLNADGTVFTQNISEADWKKGKLSTTDADGNTVDPIYASDTTWIASKTVPDYQGIDQSKLVPLLVKTIQELEARITTLESA